MAIITVTVGIASAAVAAMFPAAGNIGSISPAKTYMIDTSDGTIHRIVSNTAILKAYRIASNIAIIPSETIRYFALLY